jgi:ketosteroid isomerase-like protein
MSVTTAEHPNAHRMRQVVEAVQRGDMPAALAHFPEDVEWYSPAGRREQRVYRGRDGVTRFFSELFARSNGTMRPEVEDVLASDERLVIFLRITATKGDDELKAIVAHFATVGPNGFPRNWFLPDDLGAWNRFFS